jgi:hypothetical protein
MTWSRPWCAVRGTRAAAMVTLALVLAATGLVACGKSRAEAPTPVPLPPSSTPTVAPSPSPSASATPLPATSFASDGDPISGWYWLRDSAHKQSALWSFQILPSAPGDIVLHLQVLATDRVNGPRGIEAHFYLAWATPAGNGLPGPWLGRLPVTLPNVSPATDPLGYTCEGTLAVPRATLGDATRMVIQITRSDPRGELPSLDTQVAVDQASVSLGQ